MRFRQALSHSWLQLLAPGLAAAGSASHKRLGLGLGAWALAFGHALSPPWATAGLPPCSASAAAVGAPRAQETGRELRCSPRTRGGRGSRDKLLFTLLDCVCFPACLPVPRPQGT